MSELFQAIEQEVAIFIRRTEYARVANGVNDLDRSAYLLLTRLFKEGASTVGALAEALQLDISTVSRQIVPLMRKGYIEREASDEDKRVSVLRLTEAGLSQLQQVRAARRELYAELLGDWTEQEREQFYKLLHRFNERIKSRQRARAQHRLE